MKNFLDSLKKLFSFSKPVEEEKKEELPVKIGVLPKLQEQKGEGAKIAHGVKGQGTTEEKKKRKKKYFPKQKGQGLKNHGFPGGKVASGTSVSGGKKDKTQQDTDKTSRGKKSKRRPEFTESVYRKRENVKKS